ncbi:hypothetical protein ACFLRQ_01830 [Bacteroidota bacterium]
MKPFKILLFFAAVAGLLFVISLVIPDKGIMLGEDFQVRFISVRNLFDKDTVSTAYTDSLILNTTITDDPESGSIDSVFLMKEQISEKRIDKRINMDSLIRAKIDSISERVHPLEFTEPGKNKLHGFFKAAENSENEGKLLRVLHYGDSQIENDRMTSLLRYRFQKIFGGSGCGIVPAIPLYNGNPTFKEDAEGDWKRYTAFGRRDSTLEHDCYGMLGCFTSVPVPDNDYLPTLKFRFFLGRRASRFSKINIYMHSYADTGFIALHMNDTISDTLLIHRKGYQVLSFKPDIEPERVKLEFNMPDGGRVYGIGFDPEKGIQFDNIAMRGSSGLEFSRSDRATLDTMVNDLNPGLILMQFGGNVVPYIKKASFYKTAIKREITYLKSIFPDASILVIGPSDMSTKVNGKFVTYPKLEAVRDALREAALESDCLFWDMYEAMGGVNSIPNFVLADPPLARPDYIHFTDKGVNVMAGMFFDALMLEYGRYRTRGQEPGARSQ